MQLMPPRYIIPDLWCLAVTSGATIALLSVVQDMDAAVACDNAAITIIDQATNLPVLPRL
jgi:hypothetical protein